MLSAGAYTLDVDAFVGLGPTAATQQGHDGTVLALDDDAASSSALLGAAAATPGTTTTTPGRDKYAPAPYQVIAALPSNRNNFSKTLAGKDGSIAACEAACNADPKCLGFTRYVHSRPNDCWLYEAVPSLVSNTAANWHQKPGTKPIPHSGPTPLPPPAPPAPKPPPPPPPAIGPRCNRTGPAPYKFGKSYPAFAYENLTSWGGNAVVGDENPPQYHMYTSAMSYGRDGTN